MEMEKYEFKDIKDVDLSKLEGKERYTCLVGGIATIITGNSLKLGIFKAQTILLPCSPIVETDKLREEFNDFCGNNLDDYLSKKDKNKVFDFFLHNLSVSKEVEVSDSIDWNDYVESMTKDENSTPSKVEVSDVEIDNLKRKIEIHLETTEECIENFNISKATKDLLDQDNELFQQVLDLLSRKQGIAPCKEVYKSGDRVEIIKTGDKGTMWIINGRWVNIKLDKGETYKGETDEIRHCQMEFVAPCKVEEKCIEFAEWIKENGWFKLSDQLWQNDWSIGRFTTKELFKQFLKEGETNNG